MTFPAMSALRGGPQAAIGRARCRFPGLSAHVLGRSGLIVGASRDDVDVVTEERTASDVNRELTRLLSLTGERFGFEVLREYPVKGGRLDVVWTWSPPSPIPGLDIPVPVVGFEIESSWRTRKHVKGDLLNLQDAGVALGIIVLAGDDAKDQSLRTFAIQLVDRPGANVLVWTAADVRTLAEDSDGVGTVWPTATQTSAHRSETAARTAPESSSSAGATGGSALAKASHTGKYAALNRWLRTKEGQSFSTTFAEVERVLGFPLPNSCRNHVAHWHSYEGSAVARAILDAGWKVSRVHLSDETLAFVPADH